MATEGQEESEHIGVPSRILQWPNLCGWIEIGSGDWLGVLFLLFIIIIIFII